ncbi:alpha/beta hydrolase [Kocuria salina]|uniref:alpha/beta hydrolase n=1 Tax=Kocuria salina TaxID=1929416 RepID=UPI001594DA09|nr:alpha/beta hydrolase [Kocuria salina]NVC25004.1 alpha/beta hydrolase [Kocuria salina]
MNSSQSSTDRATTSAQDGTFSAAPDIATHVIVLPGGGYAGHADNEAEPIARWLGELGLSTSVFRYPVHAMHPAPLEAVRAEIRRVRENGAERVALLGSSAGGHLAGQAALSAAPSAPERVDAVMLCYPVVSMELETDKGSQRELLGPEPSPEARAATSLDRLVTATAPPFFIWHTADDSSVPVQHSYLLAQALARADIPHALHVFPSGTHGLGLAEASGEPEAWPGLCATWLFAMGWLR